MAEDKKFYEEKTQPLQQDELLEVAGGADTIKGGKKKQGPRAQANAGYPIGEGYAFPIGEGLASPVGEGLAFPIGEKADE